MEIVAGAVYEFVFPFIIDTYTGFGEDGPFSGVSWRPGTRYVFCSPDDTGAICDGLGFMVCAVVSIHKPGRFPTRVFYTRQWKVPQTGRPFGKTRLRTTTLGAFRAMLRGYRHPYRQADPDETTDYREQLNKQNAATVDA